MNGFRFTVCFLTRNEEVLLLLRNKPPNKGLWNGVGGHIEPGESPYQSCLREVEEETGYHLEALSFGGILTWRGFEIDNGGLYIFTAPAPNADPRPNDEGLLAWHPRRWVFTSHEVVENIHYFAPAVLSGAPPSRYHFDYLNGEIIHHRVQPVPPDIDIYQPAVPG